MALHVRYRESNYIVEVDGIWNQLELGLNQTLSSCITVNRSLSPSKSHLLHIYSGCNKVVKTKTGKSVQA